MVGQRFPSFVDSLPLTATGKLWKAEMKKQWKDFSFGS
jgi:acyl-coenzyme A synthetase/AMP-(fatty) acid ligase